MKKTDKYRIVTRNGISRIQKKVKYKQRMGLLKKKKFTQWEYIHKDEVVCLRGMSYIDGKFYSFGDAEEILYRILKKH